jgi:hypothetical protein
MPGQKKKADGKKQCHPLYFEGRQMETLCICTRADSFVVRRPVRSEPKNELWCVWLLLLILIILLKIARCF